MRDTTRDRELAGRAARGDEEAWREIYNSTCDRLFSLLCYQLGDRDEAMDLLQDTYLSAFARLRDYRGDAPLSSWLRTIAIRRAMDWKRTALRRIKQTVALNERTATVSPQTREIQFRSETRRLQEALARLSRNQRAVLLLREWEELSFEEISEQLGCRASTARVHHVRAKERMREALGDTSPRVEANGLEGQRT